MIKDNVMPTMLLITNSRGNRYTCLICNASLALPKRGNVERHFITRHAKCIYHENFPLGNEAREIKVNALKSYLR